MRAGGRTAGRGRVKLREQAYERFTQQLMAARIRPGQFLSQRELVAVIGMPLGAVRELILRLEADRLIETLPQRGMQVASVDLKLVRNVFQLWMILARAAAAQLVQVASDAEIEDLAEAHAGLMARARKRIDARLVDEARRLEWRLHDGLIAALGNEIVTDIYRVNRIKVELIRAERGQQGEAAVLSSLQQCRPIIDALKARDSARAVAAVEAQLEALLRAALAL
jgi:DNA-binding GntR family transcriptional regulator